MAGKPASALVREGASRVGLYNEGLVIYLYDSANRERILQAGGVDLVERALDGKAPLKDKSLKTFGESGLLVAYELRQDDSVEVDIAVGPPLTKDELKAVKGVKWHAPQMAKLVLPSGQLCIESPNSSRIHPDEPPQERGGVIVVPPGEYVLTLYRTKWEAMDDKVTERVQAAGHPDEFVTLTPLAKAAKAAKPGTFALPFPVRKPGSRWIGKYAVADGRFSGQIRFRDYWEFFTLNLDRAAFGQLELAFGSVLDVETGGRRFTVVYLGEGIDFGTAQLAAYALLVKHDPVMAPLADERELVLAVMRKDDETGVEVMCGMRVRAAEPIPEAWQDKWWAATAAVRPTRLEPVGLDALGRYRVENGVAHGTVLLHLGRYLSLSFDTAALDAIGARAGDVLNLRVDGHDWPVRLYANMREILAAMRAPELAGGEIAGTWRALKDEWGEADTKQRAVISGRMKELLLPDPPLAAAPDTHWIMRDRGILLVLPPAADRETYGLAFTIPFPAAPGTAVTLRKK